MVGLTERGGCWCAEEGALDGAVGGGGSGQYGYVYDLVKS